MTKPIFMWAGGKSKMIKHYQQYFPQHFDTYIEPFFGGGAIFLEAYKINPNAHFIINDINSCIINIYKSIQSDYGCFLKHLNKVSDKYLSLNKVDKKTYYYDIRHQHAFDYKNWSGTKEAATLYFLMKTGFNGIWQINKNTNGRYGTPVGLLKNFVYDKDNLDGWNKILQNNITITSKDYKLLFNNKLSNNTWTFLDPPYRGCFTKYGIKFDDDEQKKLVDFSNTMSNYGESWLCNRIVGEDNFFENYIKQQQYSTKHILYFDNTYTAGRRKKTDNGFEAKKVKEILVIM